MLGKVLYIPISTADIGIVRQGLFNFMWQRHTHKGLRTWILHIVKDHPRTGVEIMDVMESYVQGWWRPSPGSIYPLLDSMTKEGVLGRSEDKKYSLTDKGREEIEQPYPWVERDEMSMRSPERMLELMSSYVSYLEDLARSNDKRVVGNAEQFKELGARLSKLGENL